MFLLYFRLRGSYTVIFCDYFISIFSWVSKLLEIWYSVFYSITYSFPSCWDISVSSFPMYAPATFEQMPCRFAFHTGDRTGFGSRGMLAGVPEIPNLMLSVRRQTFSLITRWDGSNHSGCFSWYRRWSWNLSCWPSGSDRSHHRDASQRTSVPNRRGVKLGRQPYAAIHES